MDKLKLMKKLHGFPNCIFINENYVNPQESEIWNSSSVTARDFEARFWFE